MTVILLVILITGIATVYSVFRFPSFQQLAGRLAAEYITRHYGIEIYLDRIGITERLYIDVHGLRLMDHKKNPILESDGLRIEIIGLSLKSRNIHVGNISLSNTSFFLRKYETDSVLNFQYLLDVFKSEVEDTVTSVPLPWEFHCDEVTLDSLSFGFTDDTKEHTAEMMDFTDLLFTEIFFSAKDISIIGDSISADIQQLSCLEKSGMRLNSFSAMTTVSSSGIRAKNLHVSSNATVANLDVDFLYPDFSAFRYFLDSVFIRASIRESILTLADLRYFAPELKVMNDPIMFSGEVSGYVSDFSAKGFQFNIGDFTEFYGDVAMKGLPDINATYASINIIRLSQTPEDIENFNLPIEPPNLVLPEPVRQLGLTTVDGYYRGYMSDFTTRLNIASDLGAISLDWTMKTDSATNEPVYAGDLQGTSINAGVISGLPDLGLVDIDLEVEGRSFNPETLDIVVNGWLENFEYREYSYDKLIFGGLVKGKSYDGRLMIMDPSLSLDFIGKVDFNGELPDFNFTSDIRTAKLYALGFSDKSEDMDISGRVSGDFTGLAPDEFTGRIELYDITYFEEGKDYHLDSLVLESNHTQGEKNWTKLRSDFVDADFEGPLKLDKLEEFFSDFVLSFRPGATRPPLETGPDSSLVFKLVFKDVTPITEIFMPSVHISPGARLNGTINFSARKLEFNGSADTVYAYGIILDSLNFNGYTKSGKLYSDFYAREIIFQKEGDATVIGIPDFHLHSAAGRDSLVYEMHWDNADVVQPNKGTIQGFVLIPERSRIEAGITTASANFNGEVWSIEEGNYIILDSTFKEIRNLQISKGDELLLVDGRLSDLPSDTLSVWFKNWSLSNFNRLLESSSMSVGGVINGQVSLFMNGKVPNIFAGLNIEGFSFNEVMFGNAEIKTRWLESDKALALDMNIFARVKTGDAYKILAINGLYYPFNKKQNFDFDIYTQNLNISVLEPLLSSFSSHVAGFATGNLTLHGTLAKPVLTGNLKLQRAELMVDYLNVTYSFANEIIFEEDYIHFEKVPIYDIYTNQASIIGGIRHNFFKDFRLDLVIEPQKLLIMDLNRYQNEIFYGKAFASGTVKLSGPFNSLSFEVEAKTEKGTKVSIPINYSVNVSQGDFIVFTNQADSLVQDSAKNIQVVGLSLNIGLDITRDADIEITLPDDIGFIRTNGRGFLRLGVDRYGYLTLNGSYRISSGLFVLTFEQLVSRRFEILEGSSIEWTGDLDDAEVNIVARYRLRTSLSGLGSALMDSESGDQKVIVNTDIRLTGNLFNPELSFGINFPNLPEQTKQAVYSILDTNDRGLMNQQAISLLILSSFSTTSADVSNPVNPATIMSNTLSSMLSQISNDFDVGINYVPGDRVSSEQLEVALSTQLLDDRLIIDGNIDVSSENANSQNSSAIVGDVNIEYKLTADGRFRVKAFNRSNDLSLLNDYSPYTQGVGIFYRKEFNNVAELFRGKKAAKVGKKP